MAKAKSPLPCPFCGHEDLEVSSDDLRGDAKYVGCMTCDARGPLAHTTWGHRGDAAERSAIERWNRLTSREPESASLAPQEKP